MITFWSIAACCIALALACVLPALLRGGSPAPVSRRAAAAAVYRDQLLEVDLDVVRGTLAGDRAESARDEVRRRSLEDVGRDSQTEPSTASASFRTALGLAFVLPGLAVGLYLRLGTPDALRLYSLAATTSGHWQAGAPLQDVVSGLALRMQARPDDFEGWFVLGRAYAALGRYRDAVIAFQRAESLAAPSADLLADHADALAMLQGRRLGGVPADLVQRALEIDPEHLKSLALAASAALETQDIAAAQSHWQRIVAVAPPASPFARSARTALVQQRFGVPGAQAAVVRGIVDVAPELQPRLRRGDTLFIVARAAAGPQMPLAVLKRTAKDFPYAFELDDSLAMSPDRPLSLAGPVLVSARISRSGSATPRAGDLLTAAMPSEVGGAAVRVLIDREQQ